MSHLNIEIKARCADLDAARAVLVARGARRQGLDRQRDTYFAAPGGRLKLREGDIELSLIHYDRDDAPGPKASHVTLYHPAAEPGGGAPALRALLTRALGTRVVVEKAREIWWLDNVKIHLDEVPGLGSFLEVEAIDRDGTLGPARLRAQCEELATALGVRPADLVAESYGDLLSPRAPGAS
jgi:adenylate cyclase, class 2